MSARGLAVNGDGGEGDVTPHGPPGGVVNFEPSQTLAAGRAPHPEGRRGHAGVNAGVTVQRDLKGDAPGGGAKGTQLPVCLFIFVYFLVCLGLKPGFGYKYLNLKNKF